MGGERSRELTSHGKLCVFILYIFLSVRSCSSFIRRRWARTASPCKISRVRRLPPQWPATVSQWALPRRNLNTAMSPCCFSQVGAGGGNFRSAKDVTTASISISLHLERSVEARVFSPALNFSYLSFPGASRLWESGFSHSGVHVADSCLLLIECPCVWTSADLSLGFWHEVCVCSLHGKQRFPGAFLDLCAEAPSFRSYVCS